jgi:hypothetical protein
MTIKCTRKVEKNIIVWSKSVERKWVSSREFAFIYSKGKDGGLEVQKREHYSLIALCVNDGWSPLSKSGWCLVAPSLPIQMHALGFQAQLVHVVNDNFCEAVCD